MDVNSVLISFFFFCDVAKNFNIAFQNIAAQSSWSNGPSEKHNGILWKNVEEIKENSMWF